MSPATNGSGLRQCQSWIESFIKQTDNINSPVIFRRWAAITAIAAALEQKVWIETVPILYPSIYTLLVGRAAIGKTQAIHAADVYFREIPQCHIAPTSVTAASLVDVLTAAKRVIINLPYPAIEYNSLFIVVDEFSAFMAEYKTDLVAALTAFYDVHRPYTEDRRGRQEKPRINRPQISILGGIVPDKLMKVIPEQSWNDGFTSRIFMIYSNEKTTREDFFAKKKEFISSELSYDMIKISTLVGQAEITQEYQNAFNQWIKLGMIPVPTHPKLVDYCGRRDIHLLKLSIVASVDRGDSLKITIEDFKQAMNWLFEAEDAMPEIFNAGRGTTDSKSLDEAIYFINKRDPNGKGINEQVLKNFIKDRVPLHNVQRAIEVMVQTGMITTVKLDTKTGLRIFVAQTKET